ncbi:histone deacetylase HDT1-like isoform X2 [Herrania umbratica]|uniref:Histone deacetylase HDT1-like isoform X2 n=1 Tax=Herrania umbratica TaxID=108875 RepID=A0A6J0ZUQ3_9ROSI|nr:histone deacetylase HDT1-like isoform X2 [Herrania umbratica]
MEFWGIEVKAGKPIKADPGANHVIHLSQATLGESKNKAESVTLHVNADGQKLVLGTLSHQNFPQLSFDLVFDQEFELSHNCKHGSVYFLGYKTFVPEEGDDEFDMSSDEESSEDEELPVAAAENGKAKTDVKPSKVNAGKPDALKQAVKIEEPSNNKKTEDDDESDSEDESGSDEEDDSEDEDESDEMSMDESSDDEDEGTPKKVEASKKRPAEAATPVSAKKAKSAATPQKTDDKKGGHTATPHPSKQAGKSSAKSPKSGGQFSCGSCNKSFGSEGGLESHKKAKHGGK